MFLMKSLYYDLKHFFFMTLPIIFSGHPLFVFLIRNPEQRFLTTTFLEPDWKRIKIKIYLGWQRNEFEFLLLQSII